MIDDKLLQDNNYASEQDMLEHIEKLITTCFYNRFKQPMRTIIEEYIGYEDFCQDVMLRLWLQFNKEDTNVLENTTIQTLVFRTCDWHYSRLFSSKPRNDIKGKGWKHEAPLGKLQGTPMRSTNMSSMLPQGEEESGLNDFLDKLIRAETTDYTDTVFNTDIKKVLYQDIPREFGGNTVQSNLVLQYVLQEPDRTEGGGYITAPDIAKATGVTHQRVYQLIIILRKKIIDYLNKMGYTREVIKESFRTI